MFADHHKRERVNISSDMEPTSLTFQDDIDAFNWTPRERTRLEKTFRTFVPGKRAEAAPEDNWCQETSDLAEHYSANVARITDSQARGAETEDYFKNRYTMVRGDPKARYAALKGNRAGTKSPDTCKDLQNVLPTACQEHSTARD